MAHLRDIDVMCMTCRRARGKKQLLTYDNTVIGLYCAPCAEQALSRQRDLEQRELAAQAERRTRNRAALDAEIGPFTN